MLKITAEEVNFLVHQYLEETGYKHTAFTFRYESGIDKSALNDAHIPPSMLLMYLEKALLMLQMETHLDKDEEVVPCNHPFTLLTPHVCGYTKPSIEKPQIAQHEDPLRRPQVAQLLQNPVFQPAIPAYMLPQAAELQPAKSAASSVPPSQPAAQPQNLIQMQNSMPASSPPQGGVLRDPPKDPPVTVEHMQIDTAPALGPGPAAVKVEDKKAPLRETGGAEEEKRALRAESGVPFKAVSTSQPASVVSHAILGNMRGATVLEGHQGMVYNVSWHPSKRILASGGADSTVRLWQVGDEKKDNETVFKAGSDARGTTLLQVLPHVSNETKNPRVDVTSLNWCGKKNMLVTGASDGIARVWSETGTLVLDHL